MAILRVLKKMPWRTLTFVIAVIFVLNMTRAWNEDPSIYDDNQETVKKRFNIKLSVKISNFIYKKHRGLITVNSSFYLDGEPFRILSGSFDYFRTLPDQWEDRFEKMKAAGLNTVATSIAWNVHEGIKDSYQFVGRYNIASFIQMAQKSGLYVMVSTGPYIGAQWEFGGLPSWLLQDEFMPRSDSNSSIKFMHNVEKYFSVILPILSKLTYRNGGPIIAVLVERFRLWNKHDLDYFDALVRLHKRAKINELFFTSYNPNYPVKDPLPGVLTTVSLAHDSEVNLDGFRRKYSNQPLMVNLPAGTYDTWGEKPSNLDLKKFKDNLNNILKINASVNFDMFVGGTNFGFFSGGLNSEKLRTVATSYGCNAPITQNGDITETYKVIKEQLINFGLVTELLPISPGSSEKANYGQVKIKLQMTYEDMIPIIDSNVGSNVLDNTNSMEMLNNNVNGHGYILYRVQFKRAKVLKTGYMYDRAQVLLNGKHIALIEHHEQLRKGLILEQELLQPMGLNTIDIFVENLGRIASNTILQDQKLFNSQRKGIVGDIALDWKPVKSVEHVPFQFDADVIKQFRKSNDWKELLYLEENTPAMYKATFIVKGSPKDTYLDTSQWGKGVAFINGFNLGRYWNIQPHRMLYVPKSTLHQGENDLIMFEQHNPNTVVEFTDQGYSKHI